MNERANRKMQRELKQLRREIDAVDRMMMKALAKRFKIVQRVGKLKHKFDLPIIQKSRMIEMLNGRRDDAIRLKLDGRLIYRIFDLLHDASIKAQEEVGRVARKKKAAKKKR